MSRKDPRREAEEYLEQHNIRGLFKHLSTKLLFAKPEDPKMFLVDELRKVYDCQKDNQPIPSMFEDKDLVAMYGMFDVTGSGKISHKQVAQAMRNLGIDDYEAPSEEKVDLATFKAIAREELDKIALRMPAIE
mmetsp:Transcript_5163/g.12417  ORF Transcript_5163/g.12417 Transcript_5163/m.12417 type:complete len:133 (+) Transcript_5163:53-451(+)|eukprot:CAMPEP_0173435340 /NCGR_PEP_ID=MMETSP1357-20121228/14861_1 /TAXON_ID=77926 /ORGANISM="Hemiselmis rufescens, Strain PCC563" /LENGTH=132 /DNA_ID=CAMNT_0014400309 /DNA_START=53 /DNA_END=451 /DNA_ORIENTATION=+